MEALPGESCSSRNGASGVKADLTERRTMVLRGILLSVKKLKSLLKLNLFNNGYSEGFSGPSIRSLL